LKPFNKNGRSLQEEINAGREPRQSSKSKMRLQLRETPTLSVCEIFEPFCLSKRSTKTLYPADLQKAPWPLPRRIETVPSRRSVTAKSACLSPLKSVVIAV